LTADDQIWTELAKEVNLKGEEEWAIEEKPAIQLRADLERFYRQRAKIEL